MSVVMELKGVDLALKQLQALQLGPVRRKRLVHRMGRKVATASKRRITRQVDLNGRLFASRADRTNKRKMLIGLRRKIRVRLDGEVAVVFLPRGLMGQIGAEQQFGITKYITAKILDEQERQKRRKRRGRKKGTSDGGTKATRGQAKRLRQLGFTKSQKWIMDTFSRKLAGFIIRKEEGRTPKRSWTITLPARSFLGANSTDRQELMSIMSKELLKTA